MPQASHINDPAHWRAKAVEMRNLAADVTDENARHSMMRVAHEYERLAERAQQRAEGLPASHLEASRPASSGRPSSQR